MPKYKVMDRGLRGPDLRCPSHLTPVHCSLFLFLPVVVLLLRVGRREERYARRPINTVNHHLHDKDK